MCRFVVLFLVLGCGSESKDSVLLVDSGDPAGDDGTNADGLDDDDDDEDDDDDDDTDDDDTDDDDDDEDDDDEDDDDDDDDDDTGDDDVDEEEEEEEDTDCPDGAPDTHEPNDATPTEFGDKDGEEFVVEGGYLYPSTDSDRYSFRATDDFFDGWDLGFDVQVRLTDVPADVDLRLELWHMENSDGDAGEGMVGESDETGEGGDEAASVSEFELTFWTDRGGLYEVRITSVDGTQNCETPYTLTINADTR